jgi:hypothetical protein
MSAARFTNPVYDGYFADPFVPRSCLSGWSAGNSTPRRS